MNIESNRYHGCAPRTNILENEQEFALEFAVPGMNKKDFQINLERDIISVSAEVKNKEEDATNYSLREFGNMSFNRSFTVPKSVDHEKIKADYKDGILVVTLPKKEEEQTKISKEIKVA